MRILLVNLEFPPVGGGGANAARYLVRELVRNGHTVDVLTSRFRGLAKEEIVDGARIIRVPVRRARLDQCSVKEMMTFALSAIPHALVLATRHRYDITHVFFGVPCGHIGWLLKRLYGTPYLISLRGGDVPGFKPYGYEKHYRRVAPIIRYLWDDCDTLVAVSEGLRDQAVAVHPSVKEIYVIPNGVDTSEFKPLLRSTQPADKQPTEVSPRTPVIILTVARLIRRKGIDYLIDAAALLRERTTTPFQILIAGDGYYRPQLEKHITREKMTSYFTFLGNVPHERLASLYQSADIFCLPSLAEGMANVLLEALASGLPLVANKTGGSLENIHPEVNGFLTNKGDAADLAEKLLPLVNQPHLRQRFGAASRERAKLFSWSTVAKHYESIYDLMCQGQTTHPSISGNKT